MCMFQPMKSGHPANQKRGYLYTVCIIMFDMPLLVFNSVHSPGGNIMLPWQHWNRVNILCM